MKVPNELLEEAKEQELDIRDYLDTLCDDQFGMSYQEAVEQGLTEEYEFDEDEEYRVDLGDIDVFLYLPQDIARAKQFFDEKDKWFDENMPLDKEKIKEFGKLYGTKAFFRWMSEDY